MSILTFDEVSFSADNNDVLKDVSLVIDEGDFISITGPSGSGKSTFLKLCCNLLSPVSGHIIYQDQDVMDYEPTILRQEVAYFFQLPFLFGDTVRENIEYPFKIRNLPAQSDRISILLAAVNLSPDILAKDTKILSGGEKQRLALVRSLLFDPKVLLLDEVTASLDDENTRIVENLIVQLHQKGLTILWVTHNLDQSRRYANKVLTFDGGQIQSLEVIR